MWFTQHPSSPEEEEEKQRARKSVKGPVRLCRLGPPQGCRVRLSAELNWAEPERFMAAGLGGAAAQNHQVPHISPSPDPAGKSLTLLQAPSKPCTAPSFPRQPWEVGTVPFLEMSMDRLNNLPKGSLLQSGRAGA